MSFPLITPGEPIRLTEEVKRDLGQRLNNRITDLEDTYAPYFKDISVWWKWYYAEPRAKEKNFPFRNASNVVVPLAQIHADQLSIQAIRSLYGGGHRLWTVRTENEQWENQARNVARYINWQANGNDFNIRLVLSDWLNELYPIGSSVLALNWREDIRYVWTGSGRRAKAQKVRFARGPILEHQPRETYLWDTSSRIGEAPEIFRKCRFTYSQLRHLADIDDSGSWDKEAIEAIRYDSDADGKEEGINQEKRKREGQTGKVDSSDWKDIRECHITWPVLGEMGIGPSQVATPGEEKSTTPMVPVVVLIHRKTGRPLRCYAEPYNLPHAPFFDGYFKKRPGRGSSEGICKRLEQMQIVQTTILNQAIDSNTRANSVWGITNNKKLLQSPIDPSRPMYSPGLGKDFQELSFAKNPQADISLMQVAQVIAERQSGSSDPAMGRETRSGGHPSPATSTLALLDRTALMASGTTEMLREVVSRIGMAIATLDQQFETDEEGKIERALGSIDGEDVKNFLFPEEPIYGNFRFDIEAMSERNNPDTEMKRAVTVSQMNNNYWSSVLQGAMALDSGKLGPTATKVWQRSIEAQTNIHEHFLVAADVDDLEKFTLQIRGIQEQARQGLLGAGDIQSLTGPGGAPPGSASPVHNAPVRRAANGSAGSPLGSYGAASY